MIKVDGFTRTEPAADYIPPSVAEIAREAVRQELGVVPHDIIQDLSNIISGGRVKSSSEYREEVEELFPEPKASSTHYRYDEENSDNSTYEPLYEYGEQGAYSLPYINGYTYSKEEARERNLKNFIAYQETVCEFLRTVDTHKAQGFTPLQKSVSIMKMLSSDKNAGRNTGLRNDTDGDAILDLSAQDANKAARQINEINTDINSMPQDELEMLTSGGGGADKEDNGVPQRIKVANDMAAHKHIWRKVSRELDAMTDFKLLTGREFEANPEGEDVNNRLIKGLSEFSKVKTTEYALPESYRMYRVATHASGVRERVTRKDKKQLIYMLIDRSGSMSSKRNMPIHKAGGVLYNRLKAVAKGEAELHFTPFGLYLDPTVSVKTKEDAAKTMESFKDGLNVHGGTDIETCVKQALSNIDELLKDETLAEKPEFVIVTDGEDSVSRINPDDFTSRGLRFHAFMVAGRNNKLLEIAKATGGVGINL